MGIWLIQDVFKKWTEVCFHVKRCDVGEDVKIVELKYAAQQRLAGQPQI